MPKFVGRKISHAQIIENNANIVSASRQVGHLMCRLSYSQAVKLSPGQVWCSLDTTDRGGPRSYAKRWYRWYARVDDVLVLDMTPSMTESALRSVEAVAS